MTVRRANCAVAGLIALLALSACANTSGPASTSASPAETKASATQSTSATTPPTAEPLDQEAFSFTGFISPTGNVACMIDMDLARCDIIDRDWSPPPRPADCEFDYGQGIQLIAGEQASFVCAGDTAFGAETVLAYGDAITAGPLRCESAQSGITCRDANTGHGFILGRAAYRVF